MPAAPKKPRVVVSRNRYAFDVDSLARELQDAPVQIAGCTYHRVVKDNEVSRRARDIGQEQDLAARRAGVIRSQIDELPDDDLSKLPDLQAQANDLDDLVIEKVYELAELLLASEEGKSPPREALEATDLSIIGRLTTALLGGGEGPGPTETTNTPS